MEKQFLDFLGDSSEDRMRCVFETRQGEVVDVNVVQYETFLRGKWVPVVRYDTAHGFFHRDVYLLAGKKRLKEFVYRTTLGEALTYAIQDIRLNWETYKSTFLEKKNDKKNGKEKFQKE